jgi:hypothetical protein
MAVIQISRIQIRRGVADLSTPSGLPQLASGEFGWAVDQQRLWIGSGSVDEGAPAVENVEVLTVPSLTNILATFTASNYTYKLNRSLNGDPLHPIGAIGRTIQAKLDDTVNIKDFGGNDSSDITKALQQAIDSLYITTSSIVNGPVLELNPTNYNLTATIYLPPNARLKGVPGKTSITMLSSNTTVFQTVGIDSTGTKYFGTDILGSVDNVSVNGISFLYDASFTTTNVSPTIILDKTHNTEITDCTFKGTYDLGNTIAADVATGISIRYNNDSKLDNSNIKIENCQFTQLTHGIISIDGISNVKIKNNSFINNDRAIRLANGAFTGLSPYAVSINDNYFEKIYNEAIYVDAGSTTTNVVSENNIFRMDVGAGLTNLVGHGALSYVSPVITFKSVECTSINDNFGRFQYVQPIVSSQDGIGSDLVATTILPLVAGNHTFQTRQPMTVNIAPDPNVSSNLRPLAVVPVSTNSNALIEVDYVANKVDSARTGKITINYSKALGVQLRDDFTAQGADDGTYEPIFSAIFTNNSIVIKYLTNANGTVTFNIKAVMSAGTGASVVVG